MDLRVGDWVQYSAELIRTKKGLQRLEKQGVGRIVRCLVNKYFYVENGVRYVLIHEKDIIRKR